MRQLKLRICTFLTLFALLLVSCTAAPQTTQDIPPRESYAGSAFPLSSSPNESYLSSASSPSLQSSAYSPTSPPSLTPTPTPTPTLSQEEPFGSFTLAFTGDINLAENYKILPHAISKGRTIEQCFSPKILQRMRAADLLLVNCESSVSDRGKALSGKAYTFRTSRETALEFRDTLGADLIGLANNHVYDFGTDAFLDTLDTFKDMGLPTVGAGKNSKEAYTPYYYERSGMTVAIIATSRAEKNYFTPVAEENAPGICGCYDEEAVMKEIAEAKEKADFVIVYAHYGYEGTTVIEQIQRDISYRFIDAGADLVVGGHSHCLQGIDHYKGKLIFYSLGNYLFNLKQLPTALLELNFLDKESYTLQILPCMQTDGMVIDQTEEKKGIEILEDLRKLSPGISIDAEGYVAISS